MSGEAGAPGPDPLLAQRLGKTEAGQREITERKLMLSRAARNLLLIIDPRRPVAHWLELVKGSHLDELRQLLDAGLLVDLAALQASRAAAAQAALAFAATEPPDVPSLPSSGPAPADSPVAAPAPTPADTPAPSPASFSGTRTSLANALQLRGYRLLYDRITAEARPQLGLIRGYKLILDVERCQGAEQIRALALQFVEQVRAVRGKAEARALAQRLADPPPDP